MERVAFIEISKDGKTCVGACKEKDLLETKRHLPILDRVEMVEMTKKEAKALFILERDNKAKFQEVVRSNLPE